MEPFAAGELFSTRFLGTNKYRITAGVSGRFSKQLNYTVYGRFQRELTGEDFQRLFIAGASVKYRFNKPKKKKE